jgi:serine/threonine protein kinase
MSAEQWQASKILPNRQIIRSPGYYGSFLENPEVPNLNLPPTTLRPDLTDKDSIYLGDITRFELISKIAEGGMAEIWLAFDRKLGVKLCAKRLLQDNPNIKDVEELSKFLTAFEREGIVSARAISPYLLTVYGLFFSAENTPFLVTEYLDPAVGWNSLLHWQKKIPQMNLQDLERIFDQVCSAQRSLNRAGIHHLDLTAGNIMASPQTSKLIDLGLASGVWPINSDYFAGTPHYLPPEAWLKNGCSGDPREQVFIWGLLLYESLTGKSFWMSQEYLGLGYESQQFNLADKLRQTNLSPEIKGLLAMALAKDPHDRFSSLTEMRTFWKRLSTQPGFADLPEMNQPTMAEVFKKDLTASQIFQVPLSPELPTHLAMAS